MGKISVQAPTYGVINSPDIFQNRMDDLFQGF